MGLHYVAELCIIYVLSGVLMMGRRNPKNGVCDGQKIISNPGCGWRAVNILNKLAISYVNSFEPPTVIPVAVFFITELKSR